MRLYRRNPRESVGSRHARGIFAFWVITMGEFLSFRYRAHYIRKKIFCNKKIGTGSFKSRTNFFCESLCQIAHAFKRHAQIHVTGQRLNLLPVDEKFYTRDFGEVGQRVDD